MKLPAFQFYPADWKKDPGVQALSFHDRGVWFEILCLMHESEQRGKLLLGGQPMPDAALARLLGLDKQNLTNTLTTLLTYGVATRDPETGALINRRMVRDEEIRKIRQMAGKLGGNPALLNQTANQKPTTHLKQKSTPSSSVSSSSSASTNKEPPNPPRGEPRPRFVPPTIEEVQSYSASLNPPFVQTAKWLAHYESNGWKVGKNPMKDWRAAIRTWHAGEKPSQQPRKNNHAGTSQPDLIKKGF